MTEEPKSITGSVVLGGLATLAVAAGWAVALPALRGLDRFPSGTPGVTQLTAMP